MLKRHIIYLIAAFVITGIIFVLFIQLNKPIPGYNQNEEFKPMQDNKYSLGYALSQLENELKLAKASGGISPQEYNRIEKQLTDFEAQGETQKANSNQQFSAVQQEILDIKARNALIGPEHSDRLLKDLDSFIQAGYPSTEIDKLRQIVIELSPHIQDSLKVNSTENPPSTPSWIPPSTCTGKDVKFTASPVELKDIKYIEPMGKMGASHVTPTDHGYIINSGFDDGPINILDLRAPADGYILEIGAFPTPNNFRMIIWHSCTISTIYIHMYEIAPEILKITGEIPPSASWKGDEGPQNNRIMPIPIRAGQIMGKIKGGVDFSVHDTSTRLTGFVNPSAYSGEPWKIYSADFIEYFAEPLKTEIQEKNLRKVPPFGGKIDYDIDGKLVGNWFREGTDYQGKGSDCTYYECHLSVSYDYINPDLIKISIPNSGIEHELCKGCLGAFSVKGNTPDPADISVKNGIVKYELLTLELEEYKSIYPNGVIGVFMVQMLTDRRIKAEVFPLKTKEEVTGFTSKAKIYDRGPEEAYIQTKSLFPEQNLPTCISNTKPIFTNHITDIDKVSNIITPPNFVNGNLKTHSYVETDKQKVPVYAPVDMVLITGAHYVGGPYWFEFQVTCEIKLRFAHITDPIQKIKDVFPASPSNDSRTQEIAQKISFKAGDLIGYTTGTSEAGNWDFGVYDSTTKNRYASTTDYSKSTTYTTAVCPYDYFAPELKAKFLSLFNLRPHASMSQDGPSFCE